MLNINFTENIGCMQDAKGSADWAKAQLEQTTSVVSALQQELHALKSRLQSEAAVQQVGNQHQSSLCFLCNAGIVILVLRWICACMIVILVLR